MASKPLWKAALLAVIDDFQGHLASAAPKHARQQLEDFRRRVTRARTQAHARVIEAELEELLKSQQYFRGAARRCIRTRCKAVLAGLDRLLPLIRRQNERLRGYKASRLPSRSEKATA
jgi:hypothetical protein